MSEATDVPVDVMTEKDNKKTRKREVVYARQLAMYFAKHYTSCSLATIGTEIGNKDHATVLHACKTIDNLYDTDRSVKTTVMDLTATILALKPSAAQLVCAVCGEADIHRKMWVGVNDGDVKDSVSDNDVEDHYCMDCKANVAFITFDEFQSIKNAEELALQENEDEAHAAFYQQQEYEEQLLKLEKDLEV